MIATMNDFKAGHSNSKMILFTTDFNAKSLPIVACSSDLIPLFIDVETNMHIVYLKPHISIFKFISLP